MALKPIVGEIKSQDLNDNFSYLDERIVEGGTDPQLEADVATLAGGSVVAKADRSAFNAHLAEDVLQEEVHGLRIQTGVFNPNIMGSGGGGSNNVYEFREGNYTRINNLVIANFRVKLSTKDPALNNVIRVALPFVPARVVGGGSISFYDNLAVTGDYVGLLINLLTVSAFFEIHLANMNGGRGLLTHPRVTDNTEFRGTIIYEV